ncbi:uncharacterized protein C20orf204 homolog [Indicator indicator]|uniref:uncharacterized protein C20orf204 homolog n=1 Tax=Indicator indicator TaxID=1002788 RepID=UPI0023DEAC55|nr:uncharacterized protein C20orf204 homolog [Indicator indicator]
MPGAGVGLAAVWPPCSVPFSPPPSQPPVPSHRGAKFKPRAPAERDAAKGPGPGRAPRSRRRILPRALCCAVLLLLLVAVLSRGRRCSIAAILRQYRAVLFHEIHNLKNLSGSAERSGRAGPACRSNKDQKILHSIHNISMSLREVAAGSLRGPEELALWKVARNTDFVLRQNCRKLSKSPAHILAQPWHQRPAHRRKQLREIRKKVERLVTCWEKLYSLHASHRAPRHP